MEAVAFTVTCRAVAPCEKWTVVLMLGSAPVGVSPEVMGWREVADQAALSVDSRWADL